MIVGLTCLQLGDLALETKDVTKPTKEIKPSRRGFLLLVVVGLLAVLLIVVVGFLSFTRTELASVSHVRDNADSSDLMQSAMDWTLGNIGTYLFTYNASTQTYNVDPAFSNATASGAPKYISNSNDSSGEWWYTPYDADVKNMGTLNSFNNTANGAFSGPWGTPSPSALTFAKLCMQQKFASWKYMPQDYFPDGSISGRFRVQVLDGNAVLNVVNRDWLEDCNPARSVKRHILFRGA